MARQEIEVRVVDKTQAALKNINTRLGKLQTGLLGVNRLAAAAVTAFAGFATGAGIKGILNATQAMEGFRTQLTTYLGSQELANAEIARLSKLARSLPQDVNQLTEAFVIFNRFGLDTSNESMKAFSNIAAANSKSITQLGEAVADALTGEFERLKEFGVKVSKENGKFVARIGEDQVAVSTSTKDLIEQLKALGEEGGRFGDVTIGSLSLAMSNFRGSIFEASAALGEGGFGLAIADALNGLTDLLTKNDEAIDKIGNGLTKAFLFAKEAAILVFENIGLLAKGFALFLGLKIAVGVASIATALAGPLVKGIVLATRATKALTVAMAANPLIAAGLLIAAGIEYTTGAFTKLGEKMGILGDDGLLDDMLESSKELTKEIAGPLVKAVGDVGNLSQKVDEQFASIKERSAETNKTLTETEASLETQKKAAEAIAAAEIERGKQLETIIAGKLEEIRIAGLNAEQQEKLKLIKDAEKRLGKELTEQEKEKFDIIVSQTSQLRKQQELQKSAADLLGRAGLIDVFQVEKQNKELEKIKEAAVKIINDKEVEGSVEKFNKLMTLEESFLNQRFQNFEDYLSKRDASMEKSIHRQVLMEKKGLNEVINENVKYNLQRMGADEKQKEIVAKRIEFEKKSELEKTQFGLEQANTLFAGLGRVNKKFFAAQKAVAIAQAVINTYQGATKALATYPPPFNFLAAAGVVAAGLAQVSTIRAQQYQRGGIATAGRPAIVGEDGPELIVPKQSSTVIPREVADAIDGMGGGGKDVNVVFNIQANDTAGFDDLITSRRGLIVNLINTAMNERGRAGVTG